MYNILPSSSSDAPTSVVADDSADQIIHTGRLFLNRVLVTTFVISKCTFQNSSHNYILSINPFSSIHKTNLYMNIKQNIHVHKHQTLFFGRECDRCYQSTRAHTARTCWHCWPFHLIYRYQITRKKTIKKEWAERLIKNKLIKHHIYIHIYIYLDIPCS